MTVVRIVSAPPDPLAIARALGARPGLAVLASRGAGAPRPDDARFSFVACDPVEESDALVPSVAPEAVPGSGPAPAWIGIIPYEALRGQERAGWTRDPDDRPVCAMARPAWRRFAAIVRIDHCTGEVTVVGDDARSVDHLATLARKARRDDGSAGVARHPYVTLDAGEADAAHLDRIRQALSLIAAGDLYEINLARRIPLAIHGDALGLFTLLLESAPAPWGFLQDLGQPLVVASSPELALSVDGDRLRTCPIKGTRPRSANASEDERLARELEMDPKERAELTMAIDVHRNDLGRVAVPGTVRVLGPPRVLGGRTVWSRVAEIEAQRAPGISLDAIARAVLPCGSVTGAPKVRAMEVIARLEPWRRGLYTGVFGYVGRGGQLALAMAIRTLQLTRRDGRGSQGGGAGDAADFVGDYFSGGGIVADSIPERELEETRWKAVQLGQLGRACANSVA